MPLYLPGPYGIFKAVINRGVHYSHVIRIDRDAAAPPPRACSSTPFPDSHIIYSKVSLLSPFTVAILNRTIPSVAHLPTQSQSVIRSKARAALAYLFRVSILLSLTRSKDLMTRFPIERVPMLLLLLPIKQPRPAPLNASAYHAHARVPPLSAAGPKAAGGSPGALARFPRAQGSGGHLAARAGDSPGARGRSAYAPLRASASSWFRSAVCSFLVVLFAARRGGTSSLFVFGTRCPHLTHPVQHTSDSPLPSHSVLGVGVDRA